MEGPEWNILLFVGEDAQPSSSTPNSQFRKFILYPWWVKIFTPSTTMGTIWWRSFWRRGEKKNTIFCIEYWESWDDSYSIEYSRNSKSSLSANKASFESSRYYQYWNPPCRSYIWIWQVVGKEHVVGLVQIYSRLWRHAMMVCLWLLQVGDGTLLRHLCMTTCLGRQRDERRDHLQICP